MLIPQQDRIEFSDFLASAAQCSMVNDSAIAKASFIYWHYKNLQNFDAIALLIIYLDYKENLGDVCLRLQKKVLKEIYKEFELTVQYQKSDLDKKLLINFLELSKNLLKTLNLKELIINNRDFFSINNPRSVLIVDKDRLYSRRNFHYENTIADFFIAQKLATTNVNKSLIKNLLADVYSFDNSDDNDCHEVNWQKVAACHALLKNISIISGGPGTGKTTTVLYLLILLLCLDKKKSRIVLTAPTGKAAARMCESIISGLSRLEPLIASLASKYNFKDAKELQSLIPQQAQTLHSLLGVRPHRSIAKFNADNKLPADVIILDEASMVDMSMFYKLLMACDKDTKLIILGDKDQLCSVEAGSVLGDLCKHLYPQDPKAINQDFLHSLAELAGYSADEFKSGQLSDYAVLLQKSRRFSSDSGIKQLASIVNNTNENQSADDKFNAILDCLTKHNYQSTNAHGDLSYQFLNSLDKNFADKVKDFADAAILDSENCNDNYSPYLRYLSERDFVVQDKDVQTIFNLMDRCRILCSNHQGLVSDHNLNALIEAKIKERYNFTRKDFFPGKIVLITQNDFLQNVHNGDVGFIAYDGSINSDRKNLRVYIKSDNEQGFIKISPVFLSNFESGFAMTIHKSQGSQYDHVHVVLAFEDNNILCKELVYTAITRAKSKVSLLCSESILKKACMRNIDRESALSLRI